MPASHRVAVVMKPTPANQVPVVLRMHRLLMLDVCTGRPAGWLPDEFPAGHSVAWTPDGSRMIVGRQTYGITVDEPRVVVYDAVTLTPEAGWPFSNDGPSVQRLAASNTHLCVHFTDNSLQVYDLATKSVVATLPGGNLYIAEICWSPDGSMLAIAQQSSLAIYDAASWTQVPGAPTFSTTFSYPYPLAWSPDGSRLAIAQRSSGTALRLYDTANWSEIVTGVTHPERPSSIAWTVDGSRIGIGLDADPHLLVITVPGFVPLAVSMPADAAGGYVTPISMLPDGRVVVACNSPRRVSVIAADLQSVEQEWLTGAGSEVWSITASPWLDNTISGIVLDESEAPAAGRAVLAVHDATAAVVARTTTAADGSYTLSTPAADGHTVLLIEDDGRAQVLGSGILPL